MLLWYSHPRIATGLVLIIINLAIIFIFTAILSLISGNSFGGELAYLFTYTMCSDGIYDFVNSKEDILCFIIKIILTIIQMIIFSGALIGFVTDVLQSSFENRTLSKGKLRLKNHYVFLNWSSIGQNIIYDLSFYEGEKNVVILTDVDREEVITSIDNIFAQNKRSKKGLHIFVKNGNPSAPKHLQDISIEAAKYVGILLPSFADNSDFVSQNDLEVFKLLLNVIGVNKVANIVAETSNTLSKDKFCQVIKTTHPDDVKRITVFAHNSIIGHILGRASTNPAYSFVFQNLLSYDGCEVYGVDPMNLDEALKKYNGCIPLINYDDDCSIDEFGEFAADHLYVLSENSYSLGVRKEKKVYDRKINYNNRITIENYTLFIISDSNRTNFVINEIENCIKTYNANIKYAQFSYKDNFDEIISKIKETSGKKKIMLLSGEDRYREADDSEILMALLELKKHPFIQEECEILCELVNVNNVAAIKQLGIATVILSNSVIALYMLQLLTHDNSKRFFRDMLQSNGEDNGLFDIEICKANEIIVFDEPEIKFGCKAELVQSFYNSSNEKKMILGYIPANALLDDIRFLCNDMDLEKDVIIQENDLLILIDYSQ